MSCTPWQASLGFGKGAHMEASAASSTWNCIVMREEGPRAHARRSSGCRQCGGRRERSGGRRERSVGKHETSVSLHANLPLLVLCLCDWSPHSASPPPQVACSWLLCFLTPDACSNFSEEHRGRCRSVHLDAWQRCLRAAHPQAHQELQTVLCPAGLARHLILAFPRRNTALDGQFPVFINVTRKGYSAPTHIYDASSVTRFLQPLRTPHPNVVLRHIPAVCSSGHVKPPGQGRP